MIATDIRPQLSLTRALFRALFGPIVWAAHFSLLYALHTSLCVLGAGGAMQAVGVALTIAALAAFGLFFVWLRNPASTEAERFLDRLSFLLIILSAVGVTWAGAAAAFIAPCLQDQQSRAVTERLRVLASHEWN